MNVTLLNLFMYFKYKSIFLIQKCWSKANSFQIFRDASVNNYRNRKGVSSIEHMWEQIIHELMFAHIISINPHNSLAKSVALFSFETKTLETLN